jgi:thiosulfate dehydrogenase
LATACLALFAGLALASPSGQATPETLAKGGQLYDAWWTAAGVAQPTGNQPLWATQTTNTRTGLDTWRCKECHGWDYLGKDGAYGSGSHRTGFVGVTDASKAKSAEEIAAILKGSSNPQHNFTPALDDASINALAAFVKEGIGEDLREFVDYATKKPKAADATHGAQLYASTCQGCHGVDGTTLNFGSETAPEFVGTLAADNPQEFAHKIRFGQPGASMPAAVALGWSMQDVMDVVAHSQTLPTTKPAAPAPVATQAETLAKGGQMYDNWWTAAGVTPPTGNQPLWATQTTNTRTGLDTWRCKECHGWDYLGKDGAYGTGSRRTGFVGVTGASQTKTTEEIAGILKGSSNPQHSFSPMLDDASINTLAAFVKEGIVEDLREFIDYATKKPKTADAAHGAQLYVDTCQGCHGPDGLAIRFGTEAAPQFIGTIAVDNPQEFVHKTRLGQPASSMPAAIVLEWSMQDVLDVLAHSQTLPTTRPAQAEATPTPAPAPPAPTPPAPTPTAAPPPVTQLPRTGEPSAPLGTMALAAVAILLCGMAAWRISVNRSRAN